MPYIVFTAREIAHSLVDKMAELSAEILVLSDLTATPFSPGESPNDRYHKIAKLGKQLAETCRSLVELEAAEVARKTSAEPEKTTDLDAERSN